MSEISNILEDSAILTSQLDKLTILENNVQKAVNMAIEAKNKAENAQVKIGLFDYSKKEAINLLQSVSEGLAEGLITVTESQKVFFNYQTELTEITKRLFSIGVSNIAMNRSVVRELELKLRGESDEEISDLAKQELKNVIMQLKAQEDMMNKQARIMDKIKKQQNDLELINYKLNSILKMYECQNEKNDKFQQATSYNADTIKQLNDRIDSLDIITSKSGWKFGISIVAIGSLILNILQICGIL